MIERRTQPGYLSEGEAARESERISNMVRGFLKWNPITRVGETTNFAVDFDRSKRLVLIYGKEIPQGCSFKLAFSESETDAITDLLVKTKPYFRER